MSEKDSALLSYLMCLAFPLVGVGSFFGLPIVLGLIVRASYCKPYSTRPHVECCVCGKPQNPDHMKRCMSCGRWFCSYPSEKSPREQWDKIAGTVGLICGCILSAFTFGGTLLLAIPIGIQYLIFRSFLPVDCGGAVYGPLDATYRTQLLGERCKNCGGALAASYPSSSSSNYDDRAYDGPDGHDDNDDDRSFWDGWLVKW